MAPSCVALSAKLNNCPSTSVINPERTVLLELSENPNGSVVPGAPEKAPKPHTERDVPLESTMFPLKFKFVAVAFTNNPLVAVRLVPDAVAKLNKPVEVTLVMVPFEAVNVARFKVVPVALVKIKAVEVADENTAVPPSKFTLAAVKFKVFTVVPDAVANPSHCVEVTLVKRALIALILVPDAVANPRNPVEVTLVIDALVPVRLAIIAEVVTFKFVVTKFPVDVPPAN